MIAKISGQLVAKRENSLIINVGGLAYEVLVPLSILARVDEHVGEKGGLELITYHYLQINPTGGLPVLVGFFSEMEREFFLQFIKVSEMGRGLR